MSQLKILKNTSHGGGHRTISSMKEGSRSKILAHSWRDHRDVGVIGAGEVVHPSREILQPTKTLLIDNYDSYTYNLYQSLAVVNGVAPTVIRNDEIRWRELAQKLARKDFDNVVISPGPGSPSQPADLGVCKAVLEEGQDTPILGVCLGMQALAHIHGARVHQAPIPVHGHLSHISHSNHPLFADIPSGKNSDFLAVRYHSLAVDENSLPNCLEKIAWTCGNNEPLRLYNEENRGNNLDDELELENTSNKIVMGLAHRCHLHWGVQFHPESIGTKYGGQILSNFRKATAQFHNKKSYADSTPNLRYQKMPSSNYEDHEVSKIPKIEETEQNFNLNLQWEVIQGGLDKLGGSSAIFSSICHGNTDQTFWLDSASEEGQRFSYLGCKGGSLWRKLKFKLATPSLNASQELLPGSLEIEDDMGNSGVLSTHFLDYLEDELDAWKCERNDELPFDFTGGFVGYLGYEMKAECGAIGSQISPHPDAAMFFTDRTIAIDHHTKNVYLVAMYKRGNQEGEQAAKIWTKETKKILLNLQRHHNLREKIESHGNGFHNHVVPKTNDFRPTHDNKDRFSSGQESHTDLLLENGVPLVQRYPKNFGDKEAIQTGGEWYARRNRSGYLEDISACLNALHSGESYELCLTTKLQHANRVDPFKLYMELRTRNPSMHGAWLNFGKDVPKICCSSPERFLKGDRDGWVEARPIKGTARRYSDPILDAQSKASLLSSDKARAENLMIVDLLRNDLGRFCEVGTVHVPGLMECESYATVHNLVSTVRGKQKDGTNVIGCLRAAFPGGSMTGAPKIRSMQILDRLENGPRGVYSGSLGFIALNGTFDLNIVIRTAIVDENSVEIGAGGAIVLQSDPEEEYDEMRLKASALMRAIDHCGLNNQEIEHLEIPQVDRKPDTAHVSSI